VEQKLSRRARHRTALRAGLLAGVVIVVGAATGLAGWRLSASRPGRASSELLRLGDGSTVTALDRASVVRQTTPEPGRVVLELVRGGARFEVAHNPRRSFRVEAGDVAIEVVGTRFVVEREDERVRVTVERGRLRVRSRASGASVELAEGESAWFPSQSPAPPPARAVAPVPAPAPPPPASAPVPAPAPAPAPAPRHPRTWGAYAQDGDFDRAYEALRREGLGAVADQPAELLLAADVARLSRHPADAVAPLRRLVSGHPHDPRAPLAAFTLGRVLLEELGQPRAAADAFAEARALAPEGPLAEDALAREVEAWSRAGDAAQAQKRAQDYEAQYPNGRRRRAVRRYGGLE